MGSGENAPTTYYCSFVLIDGEQAQVHLGDWTSPQRESRSDYSAPDNQVVVGRWHEDDENGDTRYRGAAMYWQGRQVRLIDGAPAVSTRRAATAGRRGTARS